MCNSPLPQELVERSFEETARFALALLPLLRKSAECAKNDIANVPEGGKRHRESEIQLFPSVLRMRLHQLIQGHNMEYLRNGGVYLKRTHIRHGAVCLLQADQEFRLLKASKRFPTAPSGVFQEALINQKRWREFMEGGSLFPDEIPQPLLNGLIYYHAWAFELKSAFVLIPDRFTPDGKVNVAMESPLSLYADLEQTAQFRPAETINVLPVANGLVLSESEIAPAEYDPYADSETEEYEEAQLNSDLRQGGSVLEIEARENEKEDR